MLLASSSVWAGGNGKGNAFGQAGDGNPQFNWTAANDPKNTQRAAEDSVDKNSNGVLFGPTGNPNNVCNNKISAEAGRNPHCAGPSP